MTVEVVNTGSELLLGAVLNSHLAFFGERLFSVGLRVDRQVTVPDGGAIRDALAEAFDRGVDVVLVTGGLGPTTDDLTREITAELLGLPLVRDKGILAAIRERCERRGYTFQERMGRQAMVPRGAVVLPNANGTAPGLYVPPVETPSWHSPHVFLLPGPPRELRPMFDEAVLPRLAELNAGAVVKVCRTYRCVGIGESMVEARLGERLGAVAGLEIGYCARPNEVDLRLIGEAGIVDAVDADVRAELGEFIVTLSAESLEAVVVERLIGGGVTVATAESCTGGGLASRLTDVPGASAVFLRGWVTYSNESKTEELGVPVELIAEHGAVSEPVARAMAVGACERAGTDFALATTGIAGPGGGTVEKPVGTVFVALARRGGAVEVWRESYPTDRATFKTLVTQSALDRLRRAL